MGTKNNPGTFDCYANAESDEPMFVLLGRDPVASMLVVFWMMLRREVDGLEDTAKLTEAFECAQAMWSWAEAKGKVDKLVAAFAAFEEVVGGEVTFEEWRARMKEPAAAVIAELADMD